MIKEAKNKQGYKELPRSFFFFFEKAKVEELKRKWEEERLKNSDTERLKTGIVIGGCYIIQNLIFGVHLRIAVSILENSAQALR